MMKKMMTMMGSGNMIIAVDFDGTLCYGDNYPDIGKPNIKLIEYLKRRRSYGDILILWTCRENKPLQDAIEWCKKSGLEFDYFNENVPSLIKEYGDDCRKVSADIYIDDRSICNLFMEDGCINLKGCC